MNFLTGASLLALAKSVYSQYVYNKHNTTWKVLRTVFAHSLLIYQKSHSFAALTCLISDTSTTRA